MRKGRKGFGVAALLSLALMAACQDAPDGDEQKEARRSDRFNPVTTADLRVETVASAEPGADRRQWRATSDTARNQTGNMTASLEAGRGGPLTLAFASGATVRAAPIADQVGADRTGPSGTTFAAQLGTDPNAGVYVYRVSEEKLARSARTGGLCYGDKTTHLAIAEYVSARGDWVLSLAAFKGRSRPGPEASGDPQLCASYVFGVN